MTRINAFIPPTELCDQHLLAEHREIKRIPNQIKSARYNLENAPKKFTLGKGHVSFFYDKQKFLFARYKRLYLECKRRGFDITYYGDCWSNLPNEVMNIWIASSMEIRTANALIRERIKERMPKDARYYGKPLKREI